MSSWTERRVTPRKEQTCPSQVSAMDKAAKERSEQTLSFVPTVMAATRRKYTPEEKIRVVLEGFRLEVTVHDLCRREGIKPRSDYWWTKDP